jgi:hypothetical protein
VQGVDSTTTSTSAGERKKLATSQISAAREEMAAHSLEVCQFVAENRHRKLISGEEL